MFDECLVGLFLIEMSAEKWLVHRLAGSSMTRNLRPLRALKSPINLLQNQVKFLYSTFSSFHNLHHESSHLKDSTLYRLIWNRKSYFKQGNQSQKIGLNRPPTFEELVVVFIVALVCFLHSFSPVVTVLNARLPRSVACTDACGRAFFLVLFFSFSAVQFSPQCKNGEMNLNLKCFSVVACTRNVLTVVGVVLVLPSNFDKNVKS